MANTVLAAPSWLAIPFASLDRFFIVSRVSVENSCVVVFTQLLPVVALMVITGRDLQLQIFVCALTAASSSMTRCFDPCASASASAHDHPVECRCRAVFPPTFVAY